MKNPADKIFTFQEIDPEITKVKNSGKTIAFTNGVYDLIHQGHIFSLVKAAAEADYLVVGVNSDASVKRLKGEERPIQ
ncbi:MAG: adenylyltransferase/cytidyltransferase family protein, partial [Bacteroidota bacterium]